MIIGVDIGGTKIAVGLVDKDGKVRARAECPTAPERGFVDGLERIVALTRSLLPSKDSPVQGIGIGCTGPVNPNAGMIENVDFLPGWENALLAAELERIFDLPVAMENDADAAALGEWMWGVGRGTRNFLYVTISTGIGVGFIVDGKLYRGVDGAHPEIGHHVIDPSGPACACGARGCWESLASGSAMENWFYEKTSQKLTAREICGADTPHAKEAIIRAGRYMGLGLANLVTLFAPDAIALGGGLMRSRELFWAQIQDIIQSNCGYVPHKKVRLLPAKLGGDVGIIGAVCIWTLRNRSNEYGQPA